MASDKNKQFYEELKKAKSYEERYSLQLPDGFVEKIGRKTREGKDFSLSYLSWSFAEKMANILDDKFDWNADFIAGKEFGMVKISMTLFGKTREHFFPVMDTSHNPIKINLIDQWDLNNAQMRGLAKLFAMMSGIGLSLYTGEDLTEKADKNAGKGKAVFTHQSENIKMIQLIRSKMATLKMAEIDVLKKMGTTKTTLEELSSQVLSLILKKLNEKEEETKNENTSN